MLLSRHTGLTLAPHEDIVYFRHSSTRVYFRLAWPGLVLRARVQGAWLGDLSIPAALSNL